MTINTATLKWMILKEEENLKIRAYYIYSFTKSINDYDDYNDIKFCRETLQNYIIFEKVPARIHAFNILLSKM